MVSMNDSNNFTVAGRSVWLHELNVLKEIWLQLLYCFVFITNKVIPGTFCIYHVYSDFIT